MITLSVQTDGKTLATYQVWVVPQIGDVIMFSGETYIVQKRLFNFENGANIAGVTVVKGSS